MKTDNDKITYRQLMKVAAVCMYLPILRLIPTENVAYWGNGAYIAALAAALPSGLYIYFYSTFIKKRAPGQGLGDLIIRCVGSVPGKIICAVFLLWFVLYAGFTLRMSSERLVTTIFDDSNLTFISLITIAAVLPAATGKISSMCRTGEIFLLIIVGIMSLVLVMSLKDLKPEYFLPVENKGAWGFLRATTVVFDVITAIAYVGFLAGYAVKEKNELASTAKCGGSMLLFMAAITFCCVGALSASLITEMQNPFFVMVRNISAFGVVERIESVVVAVWVLADFLFLSVLMRIVGVLAKTVTGLEIKNIFYYIVGIIVYLLSLAMGKDYFILAEVSKNWIPAVNLFMTVVLLLAVFLIGKARKKI